MDKRKFQEIQRVVIPLIQTIERKRKELSFLEIALQATQNKCDHDEGGVSEYRGRRTGVCVVCGYAFITREQIDAVFSE
jgi:hypothetical protein